MSSATLFASATIPDSAVGWSVGGDNLILKTVNYGNDWTVQTSPIYLSIINGTRVGYDWYGVSFVDENTGFVVGSEGKVRSSLFLNIFLFFYLVSSWLESIYFRIIGPYNGPSNPSQLV
jgi:hypothetical protein